MAKPIKPNPTEVLNALLASSRVSSANVRKVWPILEEMLTLYYPPFRAEDDDELLRQTQIALQRYVTELCVLDHAALDARWSAALRVHRVERWPVIAAILDIDHGENRTVKYLAGVDNREKRNQDIDDLLHRVLWNGGLGREAAAPVVIRRPVEECPHTREGAPARVLLHYGHAFVQCREAPIAGCGTVDPVVGLGVTRCFVLEVLVRHHGARCVGDTNFVYDECAVGVPQTVLVGPRAVGFKIKSKS